MFEQEVQKQLLSNIINYHYRISWLLQMQIYFIAYTLVTLYICTCSCISLIMDATLQNKI